MTESDYALVGVTDDLRAVSGAPSAADYVEFRLDRADDPLDQLAAYDGSAPLIVANRPAWAGGTAGEAERLERLVAAAADDAVGLVDLELETLTEERWVLDELRDRGVELIVSAYDTDRTPSKATLDRWFEETARYGHLGKVVVRAESRNDALVLLQSLNDAANRGLAVTGHARGTIGQHTRVVGVFYGARLCYAPLPGTETDAGDIELGALSELFETTVRPRTTPS
ncbi:type I 3-dehydroquinate dehydratase [Haloarcula salina]|uniref:3-dehydroquinate dehydratase n=1 Tax=Haloarcula salina TaxID=1429914 RepID=A0AA41KG45_9EURY|nr:type I 3-dehydroquinate dehydratase [Haloarcula salina]MBV0902697.1 type I 3-dehydroquinate dehydratase [Haloarcula salina]